MDLENRLEWLEEHIQDFTSEDRRESWWLEFPSWQRARISAAWHAWWMEERPAPEWLLGLLRLIEFLKASGNPHLPLHDAVLAAFEREDAEIREHIRHDVLLAHAGLEALGREEREDEPEWAIDAEWSITTAPGHCGKPIPWGEFFGIEGYRDPLTFLKDQLPLSPMGVDPDPAIA